MGEGRINRGTLIALKICQPRGPLWYEVPARHAICSTNPNHEYNQLPLSLGIYLGFNY